MNRRPLWVVLLVTLIVGCMQQDPVSTTSAAITAETPQAFAALDPYILAELRNEGIGIRSVDGDAAALFAAMPDHGSAGSPAGVYAFRRQNGRSLGMVTPPPGETWRVPTCVRIRQTGSSGAGITDGELYVLDAGSAPLHPPFPARVYKFTYHLEGNALSTNYVSMSELRLNTNPPGGPEPPNGAVYPTSMVLLPNGMMAVTDSIIGVIWVNMDPSSAPWVPGFANPEFGMNFGPPLAGYGPDANGDPVAYLFRTPIDAYPGMEAITYMAHNQRVMFSVINGPGAGVYSMALADLLAPGSPMAKPYVQLLGRSQRGDFIDGLAVNRYNESSPWLFFQRVVCVSPEAQDCNELRRYNVDTQEIESLSHGLERGSWFAEIAIPVPLNPHSPCAIVMQAEMQEYNDPAIVGPTAQFVAPSRIVATPFCDLP